MKTFFWKDKSGRGLSGTISLDAILSDNDEDCDGDSLHEWAQSCGEGDEYNSVADKWICTGDDGKAIAKKEFTVEFYDRDVVPWDNIEVHPVADVLPGIFETCEEKDALGWCVYLHMIPDGNDGGIRCIADLPTQQLALSLADLIEKTAKNYKP